jgi:hypothetical protein
MKHLTSCLLAVALFPLSLKGQTFESPPTSRASSLLSKEWLSGKHHTVDSNVKSGGIFYFYKVKSSIGDFEVLGSDLLKIRIREVYAIETLQGITAPEAAVKGLGGQAKSQGELLGKVARHPGEAVMAFPRGIGSVVSRAGSSGKQVKADGNYKGNPVGDWFDVGEAKLKLADKLGVNPYSDNELLQKHLKRVSNYQFAGGFVLRAAVPGDGLLSVIGEGEESSILKDALTTPATKLFQQNRAALLGMGVSEPLADQFLGHSAFNPGSQTILVHSLASIGGLKNASNFISASREADSLLDVVFFQRSAEILRKYHKGQSPISEIVLFKGRVPMARDAKNRLVVPYYFDHAIWSSPSADFVNKVPKEARQRGFSSIVVAGPGTLSERLSGNFSSAGIEFVRIRL